MFTGIIEELGTVKAVEKGPKSARIRVRAKTVVAGTRIGDSIAVNGVCLTVVECSGEGFSAEVMAETLRRSDLGALKPGSKVNLERALSPSDRLGGHMVSGHIDGVGVIREIVPEDIARVYVINAPAGILKYMVKKGSVAVDGISLTVVDFDDRGFAVSLIPHTLAVTTLGTKKPGDKVNLESDMIAKYVERLFPGGGGGRSGRGDGGEGGEGGEGGGLSKGFLAEHGFI